MPLSMEEASFKNTTKGFLRASVVILFVSFTALAVDAQEITTPGKPGF